MGKGGAQLGRCLRGQAWGDACSCRCVVDTLDAVCMCEEQKRKVVTGAFVARSSSWLLS